MLVFEAKLEGKSEQYERLDEAIRTARFIRNSCIRYWMDTKGVGRYDLSAYCVVLPRNFLGQPSSTQWQGKLLQKELGQRLRGFSTTAKKQNPGRKVFPASKNMKHTVLLNTKPVGGSFLKTGEI
jgi:putative transposase